MAPLRNMSAPARQSVRSSADESHHRMCDVYILSAARTPIGRFRLGSAERPSEAAAIPTHRSSLLACQPLHRFQGVRCRHARSGLCCACHRHPDLYGMWGAWHRCAGAGITDPLASHCLRGCLPHLDQHTANPRHGALPRSVADVSARAGVRGVRSPRSRGREPTLSGADLHPSTGPTGVRVRSGVLRQPRRPGRSPRPIRVSV